jgi:hypothetical protein
MSIFVVYKKWKIFLKETNYKIGVRSNRKSEVTSAHERNFSSKKHDFSFERIF